MPTFLCCSFRAFWCQPTRRAQNTIHFCDNMVRARKNQTPCPGGPVRTHPSWAFRPETSVSLRRICKNSPPNLETHGEQYSREGVERADARPLAEIGAHCFLYSCRCCRTTIRSPIPVSFSHGSVVLVGETKERQPENGTNAFARKHRLGGLYFLFRRTDHFCVKQSQARNMHDEPATAVAAAAAAMLRPPTKRRMHRRL